MIKQTSNNQEIPLQSQIISPKDLNLQKFFKFKSFNAMQKQCLNPVLKSSENILVSAPTASGKTVIFELGIIKAMGGPSGKNCDSKLAIYICPNKALCQEKVFQWREKFESVWSHLPVNECTSDANFGGNNYKEKISNGLMIGTPEKVTHIFNNWKSYRKLISNLTLFMVDEIHLISQEDRGFLLESLLTKIKSIKNMSEFQNKPVSQVRFIAVSATLGNIKDIAQWLMVPDSGLKIFGKEFRPVQLKKMVLGFNCKTNPFLFDRYLNFKLPDLINKYSEKKPCLIFVSTQKSAVFTCEKLIDSMPNNRMYLENQLQLTSLISTANSMENSDLKVFLPYGIGFHHSSLSPSDRKNVENQFKSNNIKVLVTTSTLAQGVNLPAYLVIIKGTTGYRGQGKGYSQLSAVEIFQMMGRAGRPQFDTSGRVIVMTYRRNINKIQHMVNGDLQDIKVVSQFNKGLDNNLNSEIASRIIKTYQDAIGYFSNSLLFVQISKSQKLEKNPIRLE